MTRLRREAFFVPATTGGRRFCLLTRPPSAARGGVLYVPPLAEEMNKSRRMAALGARALAGRGWAVLQLDLAGTGDSTGSFGEATWSTWRDDVGLGWSWLRAHVGGALCLWALRAGALVVAEWLHGSGEQPALLLWQPATSGRQQLQQFLRIRTARAMLGDAGGRETTSELRNRLASGEAVDVGGYDLAPALGLGLEQSALRLPSPYRSPVTLFEVASAERTGLSPAISTIVSDWRSAGVDVDARTVAGPAFWQTQEIEVCEALVGASVDALDRAMPA